MKLASALALTLVWACAEPRAPAADAPVVEAAYEGLAAALPPDVAAAGDAPRKHGALLLLFPEQTLVLEETRFTLEQFAQYLEDFHHQLDTRGVTIQPAPGVTYDEVIKLVDILIEAGCTDITFSGFSSDPNDD